MFNFLLKRKGNVRLNRKACISFDYMKDGDFWVLDHKIQKSLKFLTSRCEFCLKILSY